MSRGNMTILGALDITQFSFLLWKTDDNRQFSWIFYNVCWMHVSVTPGQVSVDLHLKLTFSKNTKHFFLYVSRCPVYMAIHLTFCKLYAGQIKTDLFLIAPLWHDSCWRCFVTQWYKSVGVESKSLLQQISSMTNCYSARGKLNKFKLISPFFKLVQW